MKQLTVLVLVALVGGLVESRIFDKCDLKHELETHLQNPGEITLEKIICHVSQTSNFDTSVENTKTVENEQWTTYGIFQFSHHFCNGQDPTLSFCGNTCSNFLNEDITDDIQCLDQIKNQFLSDPTSASPVLQQIIAQLFTPYCHMQSGNLVECN